MKRLIPIVVMVALRASSFPLYLQHGTEFGDTESEIVFSIERDTKEIRGSRNGMNQINHTDTRGPIRSAASSGSKLPTGLDELGGSWFDDFEDENGVGWEENISITYENIKLQKAPAQTNMHPPIHPSARSQPAMAYDSTNNKVVMFGGIVLHEMKKAIKEE